MALAVGLLAFCRQYGQDLQPDHAVEHEIAAGHTDDYAMRAEAGTFTHIVVRQMGAEVTIAIRDLQGKMLVEADRPDGGFGPEAVSFIA